MGHKIELMNFTLLASDSNKAAFNQNLPTLTPFLLSYLDS